MKKFAFALLFLLLFGAAYSASINAPESVSASTAWGFSVSLPAASEFDSAEVLLDGSSLGIKWYAPGDKILVDETSIDRARVFSSSQPINGIVYFMVSPLPKGTHTIVLNVDGSESAREEIRFFEALDSADQTDLQAQISAIDGIVAGLEGNLNSLQADSLKKEDKDALMAEIDSLKEKIDSLQSSLDSVAADVSQNKGGIQALGQQTDKLNESMESGFFGLGKSWQSFGLIAVLLVAAVIVIALAYSKRHLFRFKRSIYSKSMSQDELGEALGEDGTTLADAGLAAEPNPGKWAAEKPVEERSHKFHFGDLIHRK